MCCPAHGRTSGSYSESLHQSSSPPITKQNTQNWFPWQHGEPNLEQLGLNATRPVNTHGHTNTHLHEHNGSSPAQFCFAAFAASKKTQKTPKWEKWCVKTICVLLLESNKCCCGLARWLTDIRGAGGKGPAEEIKKAI